MNRYFSLCLFLLNILFFISIRIVSAENDACSLAIKLSDKGIEKYLRLKEDIAQFQQHFTENDRTKPIQQGIDPNSLEPVDLEFDLQRRQILKYLIKAQKLCPNDTNLNFNLGFAYYQFGNYIEAEKYLKRAVIKNDINDDINADWLNLLAWIMIKNGSNPEQAIKYAKRALKQKPSSPAIQDTIIHAYIAAGKLSKAIALAEKLKNKYPNNERVRATYDVAMEAIVQDVNIGKNDSLEAKERIFSVLSKKKYGTKNKLNKKEETMLGPFTPEEFEEFIKEVTSPNSMSAYGIPRERSIGESTEEDSWPTARRILKKKTTRDTAIGKKTYHSDDIAVIIGNKNYSHSGFGVPDVDFALRDATTMKKYAISLLGFLPENIIYVQDATKARLEKIFGTRENPKGQLYNWLKPSKSDIFIYYTGHGAPDLKDRCAYLMPIDADPDYISTTGYSLNEFYNNLVKLPARKITVVLDACFSGASPKGFLLKNVSPGMLKQVNSVRGIKNTVIFTSAAQSQVSCWYPAKKHSLFTYYFLYGLNGEADKNRDKKITVGELKTYLQEKVPYWARRLAGKEQTPVVIGDNSWVLVRLR